MSDQKRRKVEFGDFQTPINLARGVCVLVAQTGFRPASILEPTCGTGSFLQASLETFPSLRQALGFEINPEYAERARAAIAPIARTHTFVEIRQSDFFLTDWSKLIGKLPEPLLVIGNPPWVTNAELSTIGSNNIPAKSNLDNLRGIDALTGKSNFDISEWMLRKNLEWLDGRNGLLAMLCKTTVARKVLMYAWQNRLTVESASLYYLDAQKYFGAAVDACLLLIRTHSAGRSSECMVYNSIYAKLSAGEIGLRGGVLVADVHLYEKWKNLAGSGLKGWRSGIKHDASKVFELRLDNGKLVNGLGECVDIEPDVVFPLLKSSDLVAHRPPRRWLIVPQKTMGEDVSHLQTDAPKTWNYLMAHAHLLDKRRSSIYKNRPASQSLESGRIPSPRGKWLFQGYIRNLILFKCHLFKDAQWFSTTHATFSRANLKKSVLYFMNLLGLSLPKSFFPLSFSGTRSAQLRLAFSTCST
ncbi:MAG: SAM-dependent DNA methyltransferase [bacterium]